MRQWQICKKCSQCINVFDMKNEDGSLTPLYECGRANIEEEEGSYNTLSEFKELQLPKNCRYKLEQIVINKNA